ELLFGDGARAAHEIAGRRIPIRRLPPCALGADETIEVVVGVRFTTVTLALDLRAQILDRLQVAGCVVVPAEMLDDRAIRAARRELAPAAFVVVHGRHASAGAQPA